MTGARARYRGRYETISHAAGEPDTLTVVELCCETRKRTTRQTSDPTTHSKGEHGRGMHDARNSYRHYYIATCARSLTAAELPPLRAEAQIARNEFLMIILFLFLSVFLFFLSLFFFCMSRRRNLSRYTLRALFSLARHVARPSLIMNGLFIVANARVSRVSDTFYDFTVCARRHPFVHSLARSLASTGLPFYRGKRMLCGL